MSNEGEPTRFTFGGPANYRIVVQGNIDAGASDRLGGMRIAATTEKGAVPTTTLIGRLKDQAHLAGVLNTIHVMHLPVLEVKKLDDE
jgi:hypothetical protein